MKNKIDFIYKPKNVIIYNHDYRESMKAYNRWQIEIEQQYIL